MADKEKEAYWKGYNDYKQYKEDFRVNPLSSFWAYNPPAGHREAYKAGWERAEKEEKR